MVYKEKVWIKEIYYYKIYTYYSVNKIHMQKVFLVVAVNLEYYIFGLLIASILKSIKMIIYI